jgi:hypothetical protein
VTSKLSYFEMGEEEEEKEKEGVFLSFGCHFWILKRGA